MKPTQSNKSIRVTSFLRRKKPTHRTALPQNILYVQEVFKPLKFGRLFDWLKVIDSGKIFVYNRRVEVITF